MHRYLKKFLVSLVFTLGTTSTLHAASFDCNKAATETEIAICNDPELSALDDLIGYFSELTFIDANYEHFGASDVSEIEYILLDIIEMMVSTILFDDFEEYFESSPFKTENWSFDLDKYNHILIINSLNRYNNDGIVLFKTNVYSRNWEKSLFTMSETLADAVDIKYQVSENKLLEKGRSNPASSITQYRFQDGCWRLIGRDIIWSNYMVEFGDDLVSLSTNFLTGKTISFLKNGTEKLEKFDPKIWCFGDNEY